RSILSSESARPSASVAWYSNTPASMSSGTSSPPKRRASEPALRRLKIARETSPRASYIGLPASAAMRRANSSRRDSTLRAARSRMSARAKRGSLRMTWKADWARAMAASTSACPQTGMWPTIEPSKGERIGSDCIEIFLLLRGRRYYGNPRVTRNRSREDDVLIEPASLRYFREVAAQGSLRHAAERLYIAQSALSRQIRALEEDLGVPLFERRARGMVLTAAGRLLLDYTE